MRNSVSKAMVAAVAALTMSAAVVLPTAQTSAAQWHGGGFGGGLHGGLGGGFRPGFVGLHPSFRPGFRPGFVGFRPRFVGFQGRRFFHPGFWNNGVWVNGWWGPAVVAGAVWSGYGNGCWVYRPVYDAGGAYLGQAYVNVCS